MMQCQHREDGLDAPGSAQQMSDGTFGAAEVDLGCFGLAVSAEEDVFYGSVFGGVAEGCAGCVRVDVVD